jgi:hypothetical protein
MNTRARELIGFLISMASLHDIEAAKMFADELEILVSESEKQVVMLREALTDDFIQWIDTRCDETFNLATGSDFPQHESGLFLDKVTTALAATQDLSNCIICDAEPFGYSLDSESLYIPARELGGAIPHDDWTTLYKARKL